MLRRLLPLAVIVLAILGFLLLKATRPEAPQAEVTERAWRVAAVTAQAESHRPELTLFGRIESPDRWRAAAPINGRILEVLVRDGERVEQGEPLLKMDPRDLQPRLLQAKADLEREQIRHRQDLEAVKQERELLALAESKVKRAEQLLSNNLGSQSNLDQAREEHARARLNLMQREQAIREHPARLSQMESRLDEAERDRARGEVVAPFAARVGRVEVAAGDQVSSGKVLLSLYPQQGLYLRARLPERHVALLRAGLRQGESLHAELEYAGQHYPAVLERIGAESEIHGVEAWLRIEGDPELPVGAVVSARLHGPMLADVFALPFAALHGGNRIYLIEEERLRGMLIERLGERREEGKIEMLVRAERLSGGVAVLATHLPNAIDGLRVEVMPE
jgi:RND family efflux transporter MFP subunit